MRYTFSLIGFFVGAIVAIVLVAVGPDILSFNHARLIFGLLALLIWAVLTFNWRGP